ncbi:ricin-type beta-trefoil lectin domain protein [Kitasatospora purpeofusca]|uniref:ricin-type beta-trefoil lectin domain protein n=1 Tax=Kitasatospora purpeofusca TaxID=67352 RepID=UPI002A5A75F8|nr:ricin-type beta-trefoil lectin domain protein [Kitasatospora purpeofusca]MDY0815188.1 ricin-type beta-trefoil lectin domain protein [Kitasatospora purpeofusca]
MRRTFAVLATALLAGAAAVTAPAATATAVEGAPATQAASPADNCSVTPDGGNYRGTCSGIDPMQTWMLGGSCATYDMNNPGIPIISPMYNLGWVAGNTSTIAGCGGTSLPWSLGITFGPTPPAGPTGQLTGYVNKCLDVRGGTSRNGTPVQMWDCLGNVNQTWRVASDGTVRAVGLCLDPQGGATGNGTPVQMWECNGAVSQQWRVRPDGAIVNVKSGRVLDVRGYDTANGAIAQLWDFNGTANQLWHAPA